MSGNKLSKILSLFIAIIAVVAAVLFVRVFLADADAIETDATIQNSVVSPLVSFSTWLLYIAVGVTILLSIIGIFKNPENLKKTILGVAIFGVVLVIAYFTADSLAVMNSQGEILEGGEAGAVTNQWTGTGIWLSTLLLGIAGIFFVVDLVKGLIKS